MVKDNKKVLVQEIEKKVKDSELIIFSNFSKLTVAADRDLRRKLRAAKADYKVYKNTLTKLALKNCNIEINEKTLVGPTSFIFSKDPVAPAKVLVSFAKDNDAIVIKGGVYLNKEISINSIKELSAMPSKQELLAKLVYILQSPIVGLVNVVQGPIRKLVYGLNAVSDSKAK